LLGSLLRLLELDADSDPLLDAPLDGVVADLLADDADAADEVDDVAAGDRIGPWQIISKLGAGGMGSVWLAERADGVYVQKVALKTIKGAGAVPPRTRSAGAAEASRHRQTMYRFKGGATATLETVWCMPDKTPFDIDERMSIIGTEGIIHVQDTFPNLGIVDGSKLHSPDTTYWPIFNGVRGGALRDEFVYFAGTALTGAPVTIGTPEDATAALEATLAAEESARSGNVVRIG